MAVIEVHALDKISIYEVADRGYGVDIEVARDTDGIYGVWAGQRGSNNGRCLEMPRVAPSSMPPTLPGR